jgi:hypothetical protein
MAEAQNAKHSVKESLTDIIVFLFNFQRLADPNGYQLAT